MMKSYGSKGISVEPKQREREVCPVVESKYGIHDAIDEVDVLINDLINRVVRLQNMLDSVLENVPETQQDVGGPRVSNSPMMGRINSHIDNLTQLNYHLETIIARVHL